MLLKVKLCQTKNYLKNNRNKSLQNFNKYQSEITEQVQNRYIDFLIDSSFQGVNKSFVLSFEFKIVQQSCK